LTILVGFYPHDQPASATDAAGRMNKDRLGAISGFLPFDACILRNTILDRFRMGKSMLVDLNIRAFDARNVFFN